MRIALTALVSAALTILTMTWLKGAPPAVSIKLENAKVKVSEVVYEPGVPRERYTRPTDQVIVFLDHCRYQRTDSQTGEKTVRERKAGEVIWHDAGEDAPVLTNLGERPYRTLLIELKREK
jgi:hypothetical protein